MNVPLYTIKDRKDGFVNLHDETHEVAGCLLKQDALVIIHMSSCYVRMVKALKLAKATLYEADQDYNDPNFTDRRMAGPRMTQAYHAVREALMQAQHDDTEERIEKAEKTQQAIVKAIELSLDYYRSIGTKKLNPYDVEQALEEALRLIKQ